MSNNVIKRAGAVCAFVSAGFAAAATNAELVVLRSDGQPAGETQATVVYNNVTDSYHITLHALYAPGGSTVYEIRGNGGEVVDELVIDVPCWTGPNGDCVPAGSPVFVRVFSDPPLGITRINNIVQAGEAETLLSHVYVTEDLGSVTAQAIGIIEAGRDVLGPIVSITPNNFMRGISYVTAGRHILGDFSAPQGRIGVIAAGGNIGMPGAPVTIECRHNTMSLIAEQDIHAAVRTNINNGNGHLYNLRCKRFFGELFTPRLSWDYWGDVPGRILIDEAFEGQIWIGESFDDEDHLIELPQHGLAGQVIINGENDPDGAWTAPIYIGPVDDQESLPLNGPGYALSSAELGGGAIGLVPFRLHLPSCVPADGALVTVEPGDDPVVVTLEHDGPVTLAGGPALSFARRAAGSTGGFQPVSASQFYVEASLDNPRQIFVTAAAGQDGFEPGYEYRIEPTANTRSDVPDQPPVTWLTPYQVTIELAPEQKCEGDLSGDGVVNVFDMLAMLAFWGNAGAFPAADLNSDGLVNALDLLALLSNWGPCDSGEIQPGG